jgi:alpha-L-rhamnosidase
MASIAQQLETPKGFAAILFLALLLLYPGLLPAPALAAGSMTSTLTINDLRCEYRQEPLGIDTPKPRLSWVLNTGRQTAYQIVVHGLWDSGKILSDQSVNVEYAGRPLASRAHCQWKVRVWDAEGKPSAWSALASWTMGILHPEDWTAQWISTEISSHPPGSGDPLTIIKASYAALDGTA